MREGKLDMPGKNRCIQTPVGMRRRLRRRILRRLYQPLCKLIFGQQLIHFLLHPLGNDLKNDEADDNGNHPFHGAEGLFVYHCFARGEPPQILNAARRKEMRYQAGGRHAYREAQEIAGKITVQVFDEFSAGLVFHKECIFIWVKYHIFPENASR